MMNQQIEIYQSPNGQIEINVHFNQETVWLNRHQLAILFNRDIKTIGKHISNIFKEGELQKDATVAKYATVQIEGNREVTRTIEHYNLDVIISVGYRVQSQQGTKFRIWATQKLKALLLQGYVINKKRLSQKEQEVKILKSGIQIMARALSVKADEEGMEWLDNYAVGLGLLDDYDHESLDAKGNTKRPAEYPSIQEYQQLIEVMRQEFDSDIFGREKDQNFKSSVIQISKGVGVEDFYPTLEEKAAMLLYLITKNHSFVDGNKRIAAACFLFFLNRNNLLRSNSGKPLISNDALASLTLYVAASKPEEMETVKRLVISVLNRNQATYK